MNFSRIGARYILTIWLIVIATTGSIIFIGYRRNNADLRRLMVIEAERLIDVVTIAAESSVHALDEVEILTAERLLNNARYIEYMTRTKIPSREELAAFALENDLHMISILDHKGDFIVRSHEHGLRPSSPSEHRPEVEAVLSGADDSRIIGFMEDGYYSGQRYGVVVRGEKVGAVVVNADSENMLDFRKTVGMGTMLKKIGMKENIRYIVLQDTLGIVSASEGVTSMSRINDDPFLMNVKPGILSWRTVIADDYNVMEIVTPLIVDDYRLGLIRLGLDTKTFREISSRAKLYFFSLFVIAAASAAFLFMYIVQRQNYSLLNIEHDHILDEVRLMEEETRRSERLTSMGRLAAGMSHEIRNPLNSISMLVQLLNTDFEVRENRDRFSRFLTSIREEIARISGIVENFLKYARPLELSRRVVSVRDVAADVLAIVGEKAKKEKIDIGIDIPHDMTCWCDADQMKQVILNLVLNAMDAVGEDGTIDISGEDTGKAVLLSISDSGGGIPENIMSGIFDPYFTTKENGTGLGLSEVHRIVTLHGGTIQAKNSGTGAVFTITIPHSG